MTHDDFKEMIAKQQQAYQDMLQQAQNAAANAASNAIYNPFQNVGLSSNTGLGQWSQATTSIPQTYLEERERQEIREHEREACVKIVMDMAEELNCPNLLHGVALAIKARSGLKVTKY